MKTEIIKINLPVQKNGIFFILSIKMDKFLNHAINNVSIDF